jgi:hypothetical protein
MQKFLFLILAAFKKIPDLFLNIMSENLYVEEGAPRQVKQLNTFDINTVDDNFFFLFDTKQVIRDSVIKLLNDF